MTGPLQALNARYERLAATGEVAAYGYSMEKISYALVLSRYGTLVDVQPLLDNGKVGQSRLVPQSFKRPGVTPRSFFLWDKSAFVLGVARDKSTKNSRIFTPSQHSALKQLHSEALAGTNDAGLRAFLAFLDEWLPERFAPPQFKPDMLDTNFVFRVDGEVEFLHERPAAREIWLLRLGSGDTPEALCLVTGMTAPVA